MLTTSKKNKVLERLATLIDESRQVIIDLNQKDVKAYQGEDESMFDRLKVDAKKVDGMIRSVKEAIELVDPEEKILYQHAHENGMQIECKTVPFGNILIIYESRPDVTIEAAITAFKAGNKIFLKGGKEAKNTNLFLTQLWKKALVAEEVDEGFVSYLDLPREETQKLIKENTHNIDLIIPRGGEGLIRFVKQNSTIPVIVSGRGNNFMYIDSECDLEMAIQIMLDGKSRISVCNALDKVLIHESLSQDESSLRKIISQLYDKGIEILGDSKLAKKYKEVSEYGTEAVMDEEFLALKILLRSVVNMDEAIQLINKHSGKHSAVIISNDDKKAEDFLRRVDVAAVYHNASTRFTDGGQFGFGAEMAISTQKVHFRGPIGIDQLVTNKWYVKGTGQVRV